MEILYLLLSMHLFFDYGIQNEDKIKNRTKDTGGVITVTHSKVLIHGITQMTPLLILFFFNGIKWYDFIIITLALLTHLGIDYIKLINKVKQEKSKRQIVDIMEKTELSNDELIENHEKLNSINKKEVSLYFFDQFLHILVITFIFIYLGTNLITDTRISFVENTHITEILSYAKYLLALLLIGSFFNISFKNLAQEYKPIELPCYKKRIEQRSEEQGEESKEEKIKPKQTGALIGTLERTLVLLALMANSYIVIGYIIAAKSIARFEKMKDKQFAEYYLIGTLSSLIWSILVFYVLLK
ncbi:MAG: DUF3307 domain-containing protein [Tenericutes bacterium]|jgi:hypothetical protein|nr:DUF3307 domain-containing protein [Mycoplasmatota bacterium]